MISFHLLSVATHHTHPFRFLSAIRGTSNGNLFAGNADADTANDVYGYCIRSTDNGKSWDSVCARFDPQISSTDFICGGSLVDDNDFQSTRSKFSRNNSIAAGLRDNKHQSNLSTKYSATMFATSRINILKKCELLLSWQERRGCSSGHSKP